VLNPSGVRFGSGEIYGVLAHFSNVIDESICVGQRRPQDANERVLLFLNMCAGQALTSTLERDIRSAIRSALSARHVPAHIFAVDDIPVGCAFTLPCLCRRQRLTRVAHLRQYTVNNKKIEIAVKQIVSGATIKPSGMVANPESLQLYYKYHDIEKFIGDKAKL
jgi:acetoacetyl-CoA synthetase